MDKQLRDKLEPIRRRLRFRRCLHGAVPGLVFGSLAAIIVGVLGRTIAIDPASGATWTTWIAVAGILLGPLGGAAATLLQRIDLGTAARATDEQCGLKDRITTAVALGDTNTVSPMQELQLRDALDHLSDVRPANVASIGRPPGLAPALALLVVAVGIILTQGNAEPTMPDEMPPPPRVAVEPPKVDGDVAAASARSVRVYEPYGPADDRLPPLGQGRLARRYFQQQNDSSPDSP